MSETAIPTEDAGTWKNLDSTVARQSEAIKRLTRREADLLIMLGDAQAIMRKRQETIDELRENHTASVARVERLTEQLASIGGVCPYCGARADLPPGHIDRCYCLPAVRSAKAELSKSIGVAQKLAEAVKQYRNHGDHVHCEGPYACSACQYADAALTQPAAKEEK